MIIHGTHFKVISIRIEKTDRCTELIYRLMEQRDRTWVLIHTVRMTSPFEIALAEAWVGIHFRARMKKLTEANEQYEAMRRRRNAKA